MASDSDSGAALTEAATGVDSGFSGGTISDDSVGLARGETLGRYVVIEKIGAGGMGVVYAAYDPELDRRVALKLLHERMQVLRETEDGTETEDDFAERRRKRLLAEAQAMARLSHRNVITVHDVGTIGDRVFIAMEFIDGQPLSRWMRDPSRSWREILRVFLQAGEGLAAAHRVGLVHRDFKPDNVLVANDGGVRVLDFGLARLSTEDEDVLPEKDETSNWRRSSLSKQTLASRVGTPAYMSPEQHLAQTCDARSDQFSFCVACYEGLYKERPFKGATAMELAFAISEGEVRPAPRGSSIPARIRRVLLRGLQPHPDDRFGDMQTLLAELRRDPMRRARRLVPVFVLGVAALGAGALLSQDSEQVCTGAQAKVDAVWNGDRSQRVRSAFVETRAPYAETAWSTIDQIMTQHAAAWAKMHADACEATALRHEQSDALLDRRMLCLDQRLVELDQLAAVYEQADRGTVERSVEAAGSLSSLEHCADAEALMAGESPPPPGVEREQLADLDEQLARARALSVSGRYNDALSTAEVALASAQVLGSLTREARASMEIAAYHMLLADGSGAEPHLYRAIELADRAGDDAVRAKAMSSLVQALGAQGRFDEARRMDRMARATLGRIGDPPLGLASIDRALGVVAIKEGKLQEAKEHIERALENVYENHPKTSSYALNTLNNLAVAQRDLGEYDAAMENFRFIEREWARQYGDDHPGSAMMRLNIGTVLSTLGQQQAAIVEYEAALETFENGIGPDCPDVGYTSEALAIAIGELGDYETALEHHARAQKIFREHDDQANLALSLDNMGVVFEQQGQLDRAVETHELAYATWKDAVGSADHPDLGFPLGHLGQDLWKLGRVEEARKKFQAALELFETANAAPNETADLRFRLARTWAEEDPGKARRMAERARSTYADMGESFAKQVAEIDAFLEGLGSVD